MHGKFEVCSKGEQKHQEVTVNEANGGQEKGFKISFEAIFFEDIMHTVQNSKGTNRP